jgi:hypothetical protein
MAETRFPTTAVKPEDVPPSVRAGFEKGSRWVAHRDAQGGTHLFVKAAQSKRDLAKGTARIERVDYGR